MKDLPLGPAQELISQLKNRIIH